MKRKKYLTGTPIKDYIQNPYEELAQMQINHIKADYEAETNPLLDALKMAGTVLTQVGINKLNKSNKSNIGQSNSNMSFPIQNFQGGGQIKPQNNNIKLPKDAEKLYNFFINKGLTHQQTSGIIGNLIQESNLNPRAKNKMGAFGIAQWLGSRKSDLINFAKGNKLDLHDIITQAKFIWHEFETTEKKAFNKLKNVNDSIDAAKSFRIFYERPGKNEIRQDKRNEYSKLVYNTFNTEKNNVNDNEETQTSKKRKNNSQGIDLLQMFDVLNKSKNKNVYDFMGDGGNVNNVPVEIEGNEVGETPEGNVFKAKGASHEQGGIDVSLPAGTEMYSKRIKVDGVSMADRKEKRKKKELTLENLLKKNKTDIILKNSLKRTRLNNQKEEMMDVHTQDFIKENIDEKTKNDNNLMDINNKRKFQGGGKIKDFIPNNLYEYLQNINSSNYFNVPYNKDFFEKTPKLKPDTEPLLNKTVLPLEEINPVQEVNPKYKNVFDYLLPALQLSKNEFPKEINPILTNNFAELMPNVNNNSKIKLDKINENKLPEEINVNDTVNDITNEKDSFFKNLNKNVENILSKTNTNNIPGIMGDLISTFSPYLTTLKNRANDVPNVNSYANYGKKGLLKLDEMKDYINSMTSEQLKNLETQRNASIKANRNNSRGVNTMRALDLVTDQNVNKAKNSIYDNQDKKMMNLISNEANLLNQIDNVVMRGEAQRLLSDKQDKDTYYSNLAQSLQDMGYGLQMMSKRLNKSKTNKDNLKLLEDLKKSGIKSSQLKSYYELLNSLNKNKKESTKEETNFSNLTKKQLLTILTQLSKNK